MNYIRHLNAFFTLVRNDERLACSHVSLYLALFQYWNYNRFQNPFPVYRNNLMQLSKIGSKNTYHKCLKELHSTGYIHCNPPINKFKPVTVNVLRLDLRDEQANLQQMDLFPQPVTRHPQPATHNPKPASSIQPPALNVPDLITSSPDFDTAPVPLSGHNIKDKQISKEGRALAHNFSGNNSLKHQTKQAPAAAQIEIPVLNAIQIFFTQEKYPSHEAVKFFNHYQSIGWKIKGITPIINWQASAHKWMLNAGKYQGAEKDEVSGQNFNSNANTAATIQNPEELYQAFIEGKKVFSQISSQHFEQLNLSLTTEAMSAAKSTRINQLMGSNNYSVNQLLQAYQSNNPDHPLCNTDHPNLLNLARRIAVLHYFQFQQSQGLKYLPP